MILCVCAAGHHTLSLLSSQVHMFIVEFLELSAFLTVHIQNPQGLRCRQAHEMFSFILMYVGNTNLRKKMFCGLGGESQNTIVHMYMMSFRFAQMWSVKYVVQLKSFLIILLSLYVHLHFLPQGECHAFSTC